jgi:hypothetical protein
METPITPTTKCPFRQSDTKRDLDCMGAQCELWTIRWTTEGLEWAGCAFKMNAMKSADGWIHV